MSNQDRELLILLAAVVILPILGWLMEWAWQRAVDRITLHYAEKWMQEDLVEVERYNRRG